MYYLFVFMHCLQWMYLLNSDQEQSKPNFVQDILITNDNATAIMYGNKLRTKNLHDSSQIILINTEGQYKRILIINLQNLHR